MHSIYIKQILIDLKGETDSSTIIVEDFTTSLRSVESSSRQKVNKQSQP